MTIAEVKLWDKTIGAISWHENKGIASFEYDKDFLTSGIDVAPLMMPFFTTASASLSTTIPSTTSQIYTFPELDRSTFFGLPGMLADSLPDKFGHTLINTWLARQGRDPQSFNPVERLCYTGNRGMGALEFSPASGPEIKNTALDVNLLVDLASDVLSQKKNLKTSFSDENKEQAMKDILRVGTSAGGARAKAVIAWNAETNEIRSGQIENNSHSSSSNSNFSYWLIKFDGVSNNKDKELDDASGYGLIEYAYYKMAKLAGIEMSECRILEENNRSHFMTKRFDRILSSKTDKTSKLHMQTLCGLAHYDFNQPGAYSYEQLLQIMHKLRLPMSSIEEQFRRLAFNIVARNQDDHVKNVAFLMDKAGTWSLSPAYDVTYSYNPQGAWTSQHQMTLNGKRDNFEIEDFKACARMISMKRGRAITILNEVQTAVEQWSTVAEEAGVSEVIAQRIAQTHRCF